ncbi:hypothetical protein [Pyrobaculum sp.]|uniref:hypothetical protein n=1 Tax=Pyrobaculum sp. TaxID=2004705 RepID=UPI003D0F8D2D
MEVVVIAPYYIAREVPCTEVVLLFGERGEVDRPAIDCGFNSEEKCVEFAVAYARAVLHKTPVVVLRRCRHIEGAVCVEADKISC